MAGLTPAAPRSESHEMCSHTQEAAPVGAGTFERDAQRVLQSLRASLLTLIERLPEPVGRPSDLERALGLSTKLAWQVHRLAHATNPVAESENVPGVAGMRQVLKAAKKRGVPQERISAVNAAMQSFEELVRSHAGDRPTFETMASGLADGEQDVLDVKLRRTAYRENSRVWGVQVKTILWSAIYHPGESDALIDAASLRGMHEIRRLRASAPFRVSLFAVGTSAEDSLPQSGLEFGDGELTDQPTILEPFCTQPIPEFATRRTGPHLETYLPPGPVGKQDAPSYFLGSAIRGITWQEEKSDPSLDMTSEVAVTKPCERFLVDTFVHSDMLPRQAPPEATTVKVYGSLNHLGQPVKPSEFVEGETLPMEIDPVARGRAVETAHTPHVPRYPEMFEHVCKRMGWRADEFVLFRWEFRYPILGSVLYTQVRLTEYGKR